MPDPQQRDPGIGAHRLLPQARSVLQNLERPDQGARAMPTAEFMCLDGEIVRYQDARIHAFSGIVKYGCGVFEGIRAY